MRFEVLLYLVKERHRVVTRRELVERFWDGHEVYEENLTKCISELRKALGDQQKPHSCIETIPAVGYRYIGTVEERVAGSADVVVTEPEIVPLVSPSRMPSKARPRPTGFSATLLLAFIVLAAIAVSVYFQYAISKEVQALSAQLSTPEKERIAKRYTDNVEAYQLYQKGRYFWNKRTEDGLVKSIGFLEQATKVD